MGLFSNIKNTAVSTFAKKFIADYLERYGELQKFNINPEAKQVEFKFLPKGENEPLSVFIEDYAVMESDSKYFFQIGKAAANKVWLSNLLEDFLVKKSIEVPNQYYNYIKLLL